MRSLIVLLALALLSMGAMACGTTGRGDGLRSTSAKTTSKALAGIAHQASQSGLEGDEDDDDNGEYVGKAYNDQDADFDDDRKSQGHGYDSDDAGIRRFGHAASTAEARELTALVERYYAASKEENGARACSLIDPDFAKKIPEDYGRSPGPLYMRGETCSAVMSHLFEHFHNQLAGKTVVTGVRIDGDHALVLLDSMTMPAGYLMFRRGGASWRIVGLLSVPLP